MPLPPPLAGVPAARLWLASQYCSGERGLHMDAQNTDAQTDRQASPARAMADFAAGLRHQDIPPPVRALAKLLILDALGCGLAATGYEFAKATLAGARALGGDGPCAVVGSTVRL